MSHVFHRDLGDTLPRAVRGDGPYLIDSDGTRYLDGSGGPGVSCLGHSHPAVIGALQAHAVIPAPGYFREIASICNRHGILLILDEVLCGMGRTGTFYAFEQEGVVPDIVTIAKGLGAGYQPIGAVIVSESVVEAVRQGSGKLRHGQTYMGHAVACAAGLAVVRAILNEDLLTNVRRMGEGLADRLNATFGDHFPRGRVARARFTLGVGARPRSCDESPVRSRAKAACARPARGSPRGSTLLPRRRDGERRKWRPHPSGTTVQRRRASPRRIDGKTRSSSQARAPRPSITRRVLRSARYTFPMDP